MYDECTQASPEDTVNCTNRNNRDKSRVKCNTSPLPDNDERNDKREFVSHLQFQPPMLVNHQPAFINLNTNGIPSRYDPHSVLTRENELEPGMYITYNSPENLTQLHRDYYSGSQERRAKHSIDMLCSLTYKHSHHLDDHRVSKTIQPLHTQLSLDDLQKQSFHDLRPLKQHIQNYSVINEYERAVKPARSFDSVSFSMPKAKLHTAQDLCHNEEQMYDRQCNDVPPQMERLPHFASLSVPRREASQRSASESCADDTANVVNHFDSETVRSRSRRPRGRPKRTLSDSDESTAFDPYYNRFACTVCSKGFPFKHSLVAHMRVHTGERPFGCKVCGGTFTQLGSLNTHKKLHDQPVFKCELCNWTTRKQDLLAKHTRLHCGQDLTNTRITNSDEPNRGHVNPMPDIINNLVINE